MAGGLELMVFKVPPNPNCSLILWYVLDLDLSALPASQEF